MKIAPTHLQINSQTRGESTTTCSSQCFHSVVSTLIKWLRLKPLMISEVPHCWVICLASYHLRVGPYYWTGGPTVGPFPLHLCLSIPLAHPSACMGSLFILPALLRDLCCLKRRDASTLCVCMWFTLLCNNSYWGVFAEGTKWSQESCSNKINACVLWMRSVCVWMIVRACCPCTYLFKFLQSDKWVPSWLCVHANIYLFCFCHASLSHLSLASPCPLCWTQNPHMIHTHILYYTTFKLIWKLVHPYPTSLNYVLPSHPRSLSSLPVHCDRWAKLPFPCRRDCNEGDKRSLVWSLPDSQKQQVWPTKTQKKATKWQPVRLLLL